MAKSATLLNAPRAGCALPGLDVVSLRRWWRAMAGFVLFDSDRKGGFGSKDIWWMHASSIP